MNHPTIEPR